MGLKEAEPCSNFKEKPNRSKTEDFSGWYAVYTRPKYEKKVYEELNLKKYDSFLPLIKKTSKWSDRLKTIEVPLFPSYVFVFLKDKRIYYEILKIDGVVCFIKFENKLATVKKSEIENIKQLINNCTNLELLQADIKIGEKRTILSGPLSGLECEIISYKGKNKILVRIDSLQQNIVAELDPSHFANRDAITVID
jgi:transcription antitermination factor NusG